jgi:hypothetical protein
MINSSVIYLISILPSLGVNGEKGIIKASLSHSPSLYTTVIYGPSVVSFPVADALRGPSFRFWRPPNRQSLGTAEDLTHVRVSILTNFPALLR